jgi:hypothetical protein
MCLLEEPKPCCRWLMTTMFKWEYKTSGCKNATSPQLQYDLKSLNDMVLKH